MEKAHLFSEGTRWRYRDRGGRGGGCDGLEQPAVMIISTGTYWQAGVTARLSCQRCCDSHHQRVTAVSRAARTSVLHSSVWMHH